MWWWEHLLLRGLILVLAVALLGLGIIMATVGIGGTAWKVVNSADLIQLELRKAADLLKVPASLTERNLGYLFKVVALTGYGTTNVAAVAICAASGGRSVHSGAAVVGTGVAAGMYMSVLLGMLRPRIWAIQIALDTSLERYFKAFQQTGDEKFLSQIHLQSGCCGLENGPIDFENWNWPLPSSCCGLFSGNCSQKRSRRLPCRTAIKRLSGEDGLFDMGYLAWVLGINSVALCALLLLLLVRGADDQIELLAKLRQQTEDRLGQRQIGGPTAAMDAQAQPGEPVVGGKAAGRGLFDGLIDKSKLPPREQELHRSLEEAMAAAAASGGGVDNRDKLMIQRMLNEDIRRKKGGSPVGGGGGVSLPNFGDQSGALRRKMAQEIEMEKRRLVDRTMAMAQAPLKSGPKLPPEEMRRSRRRSSAPRDKLLKEKLRREAELERKQREAMRADEMERERNRADDAELERTKNGMNR